MNRIAGILWDCIDSAHMRKAEAQEGTPAAGYSFFIAGSGLYPNFLSKDEIQDKTRRNVFIKEMY